VSSAESDQTYGDGTSIQPGTRQVHRSTAQEYVDGDVRWFAWVHPGATPPCTRWFVVTQGLSPGELTAALESVREDS